ncbi:O-antigen ligase [Thalassospira xiamenensis]|uniref:O-antigen ligase family protein n=1 Tax=Thalassospira xiamenensis TaxID=220697 RepID=UPI0015F01687|nr:O-antigen ligase family protein [Thalassospira xiamenensis]
MNFVRRFVFYGLLALIAIAPLPFGSNRPWAWSSLSLWVGILVLLDAVAAFADPVRGESRFMKRIAIPAVLFIPVVIWIVIQATPDILPAAAHPMWGEAAAQLGRDMAAYVSIDPELTRDALMVLLAYAGVFWLAARYGRDRGNAVTMFKFFVAVSIFYAIYGLIVFFGGWETILWYEKAAYKGNLTSTFINRNSYATYAAVGLIASVTMLASMLARDARSDADVREIIRRMAEGALAKAWLPMLGLMTNGTALMLTHSRAGFASGLIGIFAAVVGLLFSRTLPRKIAIWSIAGLVCLSVAGYGLSGDILEQRFDRTEADQVVRFAVYDRVVEAIRLAPITGYGYGTFEPGFHRFKQKSIGWATWDLAHNSYLDFGFGAGVIALLLCLIVFIVIGSKNVSGIVRRHRDQIYPITAFGVCLTVAAHSFWDFSVQIPAMGICFLFLLGLGWGQSYSSSEK